MEFEVNKLADLENVVTEMLVLANQVKVFALYGAMGAGKTTLIKQFCKRMAVTDEVNSPTFSIVNEYVTLENESIYHFDFYRINKVEEAYDIGYENYFFGGNLCLIEWPEKIEQLLPEIYVKIVIITDDMNEQRKISLDIINH
jgi:tRNA threonylcarbamoyladenosine biosynthesis protein TsaE